MALYGFCCWTFFIWHRYKKLSGLPSAAQSLLKKNEEKMTGSLLFDLMNQMYAYTAEDESPGSGE